MKNIYAVLVALFLVNGTMGQSKKPCLSCLPQGITFSTQAEIDNFQTNYPNCTQIEGDVAIGGNDITNLNGLNVLTNFGGSLTVYSTALNNLTGLDNVTSVGGDLRIGEFNGITCNENYLLTSLSGLGALTAVGAT